MKITNENALIAGLIGSQAVKSLPRFAAVQNEMGKHVLPVLPFLPVQNKQSIQKGESIDAGELWLNDEPLSPDYQFFPFSIKKESEDNFWTLPWEPLINISSKNIIAKRYVAKSGTQFVGSVKERFGTDDYEITITGAFYGQTMLGKYPTTYPKDDMQLLKAYLLAGERLQVNCEPLQLLDINWIVIQEVNFPFTKGENVQAYEIKALSDFTWSLLYDRTKGKEQNAQKSES